MRISELSRRSGVPVATIKYYLREGLLPKGEATASTQARYSEEHLRRLRLVRALVEVSEVPLARLRPVLDALDAPDTDLHTLLGVAQYAFTPTAEEPENDPEWQRAEERTGELLADLDWRVTPFSPARRQLMQAVAAMDRLGTPVDPDTLRTYAAAARQVAQRDLDAIDPDAPREESVWRAVSMSAVMEQALAALHRLAQEDESARRFGHAGAGACPPDHAGDGRDRGDRSDDGSAAQRAERDHPG